MAAEGSSGDEAQRAAPADVAGRSRPGLADTLGIVTLAACTALAIVSVTLAWTGHLRSELLFPAWILATLGLLAPARPLGWRPSRPHPATVLAAVVIILVTALNVVSSGAHVTTDRDPGVYVVAGRSLARSGTTTAPGVAGTPFATLPEARAGSAAYADFDRDGKEVELLPSPGLPALLATAQLAAGDGAMFLLMPLMAAVALAFFAALAMRIAGPWFGLVATAGLCASLAEAYIARDAFAEVPTQALVMGGFWLLLQALDSGRPMRALVAGAAIGATVAIHFPALVVVASLVVAAALESVLGSTAVDGQRRNRAYLVACATALPLAAYGALGLRHWNHAYEHAHQAFILDFWALIAVGLGIWGVALVLRRTGRLPSADAAVRRWTGYVAGGGVALAAVYGLAIRPSVERAHDPVLIPAAVAGIQRAAGVAIEPDRSLRGAEHAVAGGLHGAGRARARPGGADLGLRPGGAPGGVRPPPHPPAGRDRDSKHQLNQVECT